jgi:hypothetical protein
MAYYKSSKPDWIASPVGIAPRPFIAGALREWPVRKYNLGPTTNYRMPGMSGCGVCGGFGEGDAATQVLMSETVPGGNVGIDVAAGVAAGALLASAGVPESGFWDDVFDSGGGDGTPEDASYDAYSTDVTHTGSGQTVPTPPTGAPAPVPEPVKAGGSLLVPVLLGLGLLGLVLWSRPKKARRNAGRIQQRRRRAGRTWIDSTRRPRRTRKQYKAMRRRGKRAYNRIRDGKGRFKRRRGL